MQGRVGAPKTHFELPQYKLKSSADAESLEATAAAGSAGAAAANQRANNFTLALVLFASSLFFAGISTKLGSIQARTATLALGCVLFLGTLVWIATLPTLVSV